MFGKISKIFINSSYESTGKILFFMFRLKSNYFYNLPENTFILQEMQFLNLIDDDEKWTLTESELQIMPNDKAEMWREYDKKFRDRCTLIMQFYFDINSISIAKMPMSQSQLDLYNVLSSTLTSDFLKILLLTSEFFPDRNYITFQHRKVRNHAMNVLDSTLDLIRQSMEVP